MPTFTPPVVNEGIQTGHGLFRHYSLPRGVSVAVQDGVATVVRFPTIEEMGLAAAFYVGGHEYEITDAEAAVLTDSGFGDYIT